MAKITGLLFLVLIPFISFSKVHKTYLIDFTNKREDIEQSSGSVIKKVERNADFKLQQQPTLALLKSALENVTQLDSIYMYHFLSLTDSSLVGKECFQYDQHGNQTLDICYNWNNKWVNDWKFESAHDENGYQTLAALYLWDHSNNQWYGEYKYEVSYNSNGVIILLCSCEWDWSANRWDDDDKTESVYNENGQLISTIGVRRNATTQQWEVNSTDEYIYDENGKMHTITSLTRDTTTNLLIAFSKSEYIYNQNDTTIIVSVWNKNTVQWVNSFRNEYIHNINGYDSLQIVSEFDSLNSQWVGQNKYEFDYDTHGNKTKDEDYYWDKTNSQWAGMVKWEYGYDANNNQTSYTYYNWDSTNHCWVGFMKQESAFDANGNRTFIVNYYWEVPSSAWRYSSKVENTYDDKGNLTLNEMFFMNGDNQWISSVKYTYGYNSLGKQTMDAYYSLIISMNQWEGWMNEYIYDENGNIAVAVHYELNITTNQLILSDKSYYHYSSENGPSGVSLAGQNSIKIYPNPAKDLVYLEVDNKSITRCSIYNLNGQLMLNYPIENGKSTIDVSRLSKGLYTIQIQTKNGPITQKMVKE